MTSTEASSSVPGLPDHGALGYLQLPAQNILESAEFYAKTFGWRTSPPDAGFEAPGLIGQWITDRAAAPDGGPLIWIWVHDIERALAISADQGGRTVDPPSLDGGERWLATLIEPGGNLIGIVSAANDPAAAHA